MFLARRPAAADINQFLRNSMELPLSCASPGILDREVAAARHDEIAGVIGHGAADSARAVAALRAWEHFHLGWVELHPEGAPIARGTVVAVLIRHLGFWSLNGCRVLAVDEGDARFGFTYGTLPNHAEAGEERFEVWCDPTDDRVWYRIRAISSPHALLARIGQPMVRALQARFRRDSLAAMRRAVPGERSFS
jgi:uncharacterized protein (UPF0548 family)